ncbi:GntR family transcriptional regulator [Pseudohoeflea coraliihabitans]|uniref:GntR family transcriptional regulator n=1 Tax=Pseudohoeflea coraliihabitans TaxID=2860393 RepID=A0ABS6WQA3_9HYPH|nr:GntR family transcriptional regulator [Pseudohoeflea sp. DP4N28-3]MBW3097818.1 GntR family transcriptional regulator [Pseudohoeflea sp. DP4N28-3]
MKNDSRTAPRYERIEAALLDAIADGRLAEGTVLNEGPVANVFKTSRTPVRKALAELNAKGALARFDGRGFIVAGQNNGAMQHVRRLKLSAEMLGAASEAEYETPRASAAIIAEDFEREIVNAMPFGLYRINEMAAAEHYQVSRTIIRELLQRLQDRGLVRKDRRSHWVVGPLTARDVAHYFSIRQKLEPLALRESAPEMALDDICEMVTRTREALESGDDVMGERVDALERDIHWRLLRQTSNQHLLRMIEQSQIALVVNKVFSSSIGARPFRQPLEEHAIILEFVIRGSHDAAANALEEHLRLSADRTGKRLMALSVFPTPDFHGYLKPESRFTD